MTPRLRSLVFLLSTFALTAIFASRGSAQIVTIGNPPDAGIGNAFPFGNTGTLDSRYQQVYNSALFSGPITIQDIVFFQTQSFVGGPGGIGVQSATYSLRLSTTSKPVNGLDTSNFDNNVGADAKVFFSGILSGPLSAFKLDIPGISFLYDPSKGNLLLDISKTLAKNTDTDIFLDSRNKTANGLFSRACTFCTDSSENYGLVTQFGARGNAAVPEPGLACASLGLFASAGLLGIRIRRSTSRLV